MQTQGAPRRNMHIVVVRNHILCRFSVTSDVECVRVCTSTWRQHSSTKHRGTYVVYMIHVNRPRVFAESTLQAAPSVRAVCRCQHAH
jgi:hypothetical protein